MRIFGLDFTSVPTPRKPLTCTCCELHGTQLHVQEYRLLGNFAGFEAFLQQDGPWVAALDFPFGQPRTLITNLGWPATWPGYVSLIATMGKERFEETLASYRTGRIAGDKLHLRATDRLAGARSPMMLHRVPVGKMFFQGAPRLLASPVSVLPCRPTADSRMVIEGYPALVARCLIGKQSYKSDERQQQTLAQRAARRALLDELCSEKLPSCYGVRLVLSAQLVQQFVEEAMGDGLDALLCALQAAWAYTQRTHGYGIPPTCDALEGWIVDPQTKPP
jgi:hypothetical protein